MPEFSVTVGCNAVHLARSEGDATYRADAARGTLTEVRSRQRAATAARPAAPFPSAVMPVLGVAAMGILAAGVTAVTATSSTTVARRARLAARSAAPGRARHSATMQSSTGATGPGGAGSGATGTGTTTTVPLPPITPLATRVEFFEPYDGTRLDPSVRVDGTRSGSCFSGSLPVDDPHAWRCMTANEILDPCFAPPVEADPAVLACGTPWSGVELLRLEGPLPRALADRGSAPSVGWLLQLSNGVRCQISQGAAGIVDGVAVAYLCSHGSAAGTLDWSEEPWTVQYLSASGHSAQRVDVTVAWGG